MANDWRKEALCRGLMPDLFYDPKSTDDAKALCAQCPVQEPCLEFALTEVDAGHTAKVVSGLGVWGGLDGAERVALKKLNRRVA